MHEAESGKNESAILNKGWFIKNTNIIHYIVAELSSGKAEDLNKASLIVYSS